MYGVSSGSDSLAFWVKKRSGSFPPGAPPAVRSGPAASTATRASSEKVSRTREDPGRRWRSMGAVRSSADNGDGPGAAVIFSNRRPKARQVSLVSRPARATVGGARGGGVAAVRKGFRRRGRKVSGVYNPFTGGEARQ